MYTSQQIKNSLKTTETVPTQTYTKHIRLGHAGITDLKGKEYLNTVITLKQKFIPTGVCDQT